MSVNEMLMAAAGQAGGANEFVEDVFSTWLYTGNGSSQTITNGINLSGKGGLVWIKDRTAPENHCLFDTVRGNTKRLISNLTNAQATVSDEITSFNNNGFSLGAGSTGFTNNNGENFCSWTFREQPKFFDVVTGTGSGTFNHSLGVTPGMIIIKLTNGTSDWWTVHRSSNGYFRLNLTNAAASTGTPGIASTGAWVNANSTTFNTSNFVSAGESFVAYLFAHDAGGFGTAGTDNIITCGTFTTDANGNATVNLGYEPQYLMYKSTSADGSWIILDTMRAFCATADSSSRLAAQSSSGESTGLGGSPSATGFYGDNANMFAASDTTYIYMAIRRPMKVPTAGTEVFNAITRTGTGSNATVTGAGFAPDAVAIFERSQSSSNQGTVWFDRSRGVYRLISSHTTSAETDNDKTLTAFNMNGFSLGTDSSVWGTNQSGADYINYVFKRASKFFDIVCYAGTGSTRTVTHNLGVVPELIITADRSVGSGWAVYTAETGNTKFMELSETATPQTSSGAWDNTSPTSSVFTVKNLGSTNASGRNYFAYLFATLAGISKVGSYTGNGSSQTINCGFSGGARFVLIKRTSASGDWYVWDTVRGIVSGNDPHLSLDSNVAEVTTDDSIDPDNSGFIVNQLSATNINVSSATYIFLAIA